MLTFYSAVLSKVFTALGVFWSLFLCVCVVWQPGLLEKEYIFNNLYGENNIILSLLE
jgi:hypothetical protein